MKEPEMLSECRVSYWHLQCRSHPEPFLPLTSSSSQVLLALLPASTPHLCTSLFLPRPSLSHLLCGLWWQPPNWPPSCHFANATPSSTFKTENQPTTDPFSKPCLSLLKSQTSPSHVDERVITWLLPTSPALSHMLLCSLSHPLQPLSLLLGHQVFLLCEASALSSSSAWLALSPTPDWRGSFCSLEAPAQMSPSQTTLSKAGHPLSSCCHSPGLFSPQQYRVSIVHCLSPQADCKLHEGRMLAWFIASSSVSCTVIKPEKWISTRVDIHEGMEEGESLVPAGL